MKKILIVLFEGVELLEIAPFIDIFGWNNILNKNKIQVETLGDSPHITCCWSCKISPEIVFKESVSFDDYYAIIFPGGFGSKGYFNAFQNSPFVSFFKNYLLTNNLSSTFFVGICTGTFVLKELNILKYKKATTYLRESERFFKQLFTDDIIPVKEKIVIDGNIITTSGPSTAVETAFLLLEKLTSYENCTLIKKEMGFDI